MHQRSLFFVEAQSPRSVAREGPSSFLRSVRDTAQAFGGIVDATVSHDDEWNFLQIGRYLERAAMTARILRNHDFSDESAHECSVCSRCAVPANRSLRRSGCRRIRTSAVVLVFAPQFSAVDSLLHARSRPRASPHLRDGDGRVFERSRARDGRLQAMLDFVQIGEVLDEGGDRFAARFANAPMPSARRSRRAISRVFRLLGQTETGRRRSWIARVTP